MASVPEAGLLVIADLTGYTAYLSGAEIEHAPTIAGDLLETIVGRLEPPFRLAKFEGDAAFLFAEDGRGDASLLLDAIEASYLGFRRRLRSIEQATTCDCAACRTAPRLDLKFFIHHGQYVRGRIAGRDELAGGAIIIVHRLLKGATAAAAHTDDGRASGFAVFTGQAVEALGLDVSALGLREATEWIEHFGELATFTLDLEARWQTDTEQRRLIIPEGAAMLDIEMDVAVPPPIAWAHLTSPALRPSWEGPIQIAETPRAGRRGVGTTAQCVTGRLATLEEIVDWQPFEYAGYRLVVPEVGAVDAAYDLSPIDGGTSVRVRWAPLDSGDADPTAIRLVVGEKAEAFERLRRLLSTDVQPTSSYPLSALGSDAPTLDGLVGSTEVST